MFCKSLVIAALFAACATTAIAQPREDYPTARLHVAALDMTTEAGANEAMRQVKRIANDLCRQDIFAPIELRSRAAERACRDSVYEQAAARLTAPLVQARLAAHVRARTYASN